MPSPTESARAAGLRYFTDSRPGFRRQKRGASFQYFSPKGRAIKDRETLRRIARLAIPPAWTRVWISPIANGHLQATGRDARGRKQYRYHADWRAVRDENKYGRMIAFGRALSKMRKRVRADLRGTGLSKNKVLAALIRLLETTSIRVGNEEYARTNKSYGLTTLRDRHAKIHGDTIDFEFRGKSGKAHKVSVTDRQLAKIVKGCQDLPDQELFAYVDVNGQWQDVKSNDVNDYIREISGEEFTAKDFRTWAGTVLAAIALREFERFTTLREAKGNIVRAVEAVAKMLGNTPAVCRKCYIHPVVIESYMDGNTIAALQQRTERKLARDLHRLHPEEAAVLAMLQQRFAAVPKGAARTRTRDI